MKKYETMGLEDLDWCRCYHGTAPDGTECYAVVCEGKIVSAMIGGDPQDPPIDNATADDVARLARTVNPDYIQYQGWDDQHIALEAMPDRCGCANCPWRNDCEVMGADAEDE